MNIENRRTIWPKFTAFLEQDVLIGGCSVTELAQTHQTPLYIFDEATIRLYAQQYLAGLASYQRGGSIYYACKALLNSAVARLMADLGLGLDVVSLNELAIARHAGVNLARCHLHGNATPPHEIKTAIEWGIGRIIIDNFDQLETIINISQQRQQPVDVLLRIAPDIIAGGHKHIQTGSAESKFGFNDPHPALERALQHPNVNVLGLHAHIGSQISDLAKLKASTVTLLGMAAALTGRFPEWDLQELCVGGGLGVPTVKGRPTVSIADYCRVIVETISAECKHHNLPLPHLSMEPGRSLVAQAGVAVYTITGQKRLNSAPSYLHVDGGMADNVRPALYNAEYETVVVNRPNAIPSERYQISGRYCESGDMLIHDIALPSAQTGDLLAIPVAGAYTLSMASNYNGTGRPCVLFVDDGTARVVQRRETWQDLIQRDVNF